MDTDFFATKMHKRRRRGKAEISTASRARQRFLSILLRDSPGCLADAVEFEQLVISCGDVPETRFRSKFARCFRCFDRFCELTGFRIRRGKCSENDWFLMAGQL